MKKRNIKWVGLLTTLLLMWFFFFGDVPYDKDVQSVMYISNSNSHSQVRIGDVSVNEGAITLDMDIKNPMKHDTLEDFTISSFSKNNPLFVESGQFIAKEKELTFNGFGMRQSIQADGQDVIVNGTKNYITIHGSSNNIVIRGTANKVTVDTANSIRVLGMCNRLNYGLLNYKDSVSTTGMLNFVRTKSR